MTTSSTAISGAAVLDLPRVIEQMPGHAPRNVARRPSLLASLRSARRRADRVEDRLASRLHRDLVVSHGRLELEPEPGCVCGLGVDDVFGDLVAVAATAPRSLAQLGGRFRDCLVEYCPRRPQQRADSFRLEGRQRLRVIRRRQAGCAEIGGGVALHTLDDLEGAFWVGLK